MDASSPEVMDLLWLRVIEIGETRQEAMQNVRRQLEKKPEGSDVHERAPE